MRMTETGLAESATLNEPRRWRTVICPALALALLGAILIANVYRASTQSVTHDEAVTYESFLAQKQYRIFTRFDANHHLLHTHLCFLTTFLFGASELSMRLPSLCGGVLYLWMCYRLCRFLY